jgi:hypothetical protein
VATGSPKEPNADALPDAPAFDAGAQRVDDADGFMTWNARPLDGEKTLDRRRIGVTDTAGIDPNAHVGSTRVREWLPRQFQFARGNRLNSPIRTFRRRHFDLPTKPYSRAERYRHPHVAARSQMPPFQP